MLTLFSPAKINLFLRIVKRREDGFHELASLFQTISLADQITFERSERDVLTCTEPSIPCDDRNLVTKALHLFRHKTGLTQNYRIHIDKKIPIEAGLGGGSSNAATTLWVLNELSHRPAPLEKLQTWAAELGSDVPFFLSEGTTYCTGRGEIMRSLAPLPAQSVHIVTPDWGLSTPQVYKTLTISTLQLRDPLHTLKQFQSGQPTYFNDLEAPAFTLSPQTKALKKSLLKCGFHTVLLSGSGSSFFCLGKGQMPHDSSLKCHTAHFVNRTQRFWYEFKETHF